MSIPWTGTSCRRWSLQERADHYRTTFPQWPGSWPTIAPSGALQALWVLGNDYRSTSGFYGAYPPAYLRRMAALFADVPFTVRRSGVEQPNVLHACSGGLAAGPYHRLELNPDVEAEYHGSIYDAAAVLGVDRRGPYQLAYVDPPYTAADATRYGTPMVDRRKALLALADVVEPGGFVVWLDTVWPMHRKAQWVTVGWIPIVRSTNHRVRLATIFERQPSTAVDEKG